MNQRKSLTGAGLVTLLLTSSPLMLLVLPSRYTQAHASSPPNEPGCQFPDFLQTKKNKNWMMNQSNTITTFDVDGGKIYARYGACTRPRGYQWRRQSGRADCMESNFTRVCLARRGDSKYIVRHIESTYGDKFVCMEFLQRGISVVQVKMSLILGESYVQRLCDPDYNFVDPWPWISEEHYRSPAVDCPFSAGLNLHLKYSNPPPAGRMSYDYYGVLSAYSNYGETDPHACADSTTASSRIESDCVPREGVVFNFKHESCLPAGSRLALKQRALCMATWRQEGEDFAMLRADNNDRNFFCLRVSYDNTTHEVSEVALFEAWVCPTSSAQRLAPQHDAHYSLMVFEALSKQVVTEPCSDQLRTCHKHSSFCRGLQCMRTCGKCFPSRDSVARREGTAADTGSSGSNRVAKKATLDTRNRFAAQNSRDSVRDRPHQTPGGFSGDGGGYVEHNDKDNNPARLEGESTEQRAYRQPCTFPESMRGAWLQRTVDGTDERLVITESTLHHPSLGALDCITFSPPGSEAVPLRRVLWGHYDNGCYPRFTCIHYNTPAKSVMRYRLADVQQWPLQLSDDVICDEKNFLEPPDMYQPGDRYTERSWEVVRREGHIHKMACILPHYLPRVVSFMDDRGRSGCFVHGTYYSPRAISLTFFPKEQRRGSNSSPTTKGDKFVGADNDETGAGKNGVEHRTGTGDGYRYDGRGNTFEGDVIWNGNGSDGMLYAVGPYPQSYGRAEDRRDANDGHRARGSHGRNLKRSHARQSSPGARGSDSSKAKTRHSRQYVDNHGQRRGRRETAITLPNTIDNSEGNAVDVTKLVHEPKSISDPEISTHVKIHNRETDKDDGSTGTDSSNFATIFNNDDSDDDDGDDGDMFYKFINDNAILGRKGQRRKRRGTRSKPKKGHVKISYECLAVMTYVDSYKSLLTVTTENPDEILCWLVVDEYTVVILKTSSCNSQTAQRVLDDHARNSKYGQHLYRILNLHQGEKDCDAMFPAEKIWPEPVPILGQDDTNSGASSPSRSAIVLQTILSSQLCVVALVLLASH